MKKELNLKIQKKFKKSLEATFVSHDPTPFGNS